ncbi:helix-turn-helix domain-containing protein [Chryseobacterium vrystaatense]|uniref:Helix-turn-helix domain-containing protein n=1 Tax=Chryseobacterium vrystaatense TaxID=307480 RepID=A0A1M5LQI0_9FLAO|nr:helix-turn-helix transcriptional regulator [Chryseobacterium vrystaatense]SHG67337.1 Helix-turn-helix domain-containing protein [Chryseobacterium vrystaatense]
MESQIHQGKNVKRFREMLGIKQEALALDLGDEWNQKKVSLLEQKEVIDDSVLKKISEVLKIPVDVFQNFDEEQAVNVIANTVTTVNDHATGQLFQINSTINTSEKWMEALAEIRNLQEEKIILYERMLKEKDDMMARLEKLLENK